MRALLLPACLLAGYFLLHIPVSSVTAPATVSPGYYIDLNEPANNISYQQGKQPVSLYYRAASEPVSTFRVFQINERGGVEKQLSLPTGGPLTNASGEPVDPPRGSGFLTAPAEGAFYIWYPRLGRYVYVFDQRGRFLWRKQESRYLESFASGKFILAMAGDHSRALFFKPSLEKVNDVEGHLAITYRLRNDDKEKARYHACMGFLDGDIVFLNNETQKNKRISTNKTLKSLDCNLDTGEFVAQIEGRKQTERGVVARDQLIFDNIEQAISGDWQEEVMLKDHFPQTLPLALHPALAVVVTGGPTGQRAVLIKDYEIQQELSLAAFGQGASVEDWQSQVLPGGVVLYNSKALLYFKAEGLVFFQSLRKNQRVVAQGNTVFLQNSNHIFSVKLD